MTPKLWETRLGWYMESAKSEKLKAVCGNGRPFSFDCWSELEPHWPIHFLLLAAVEEMDKFQVKQMKM